MDSNKILKDVAKWNGGYTPGPWSACHNGDCTCKQVWSVTVGVPVATVESGEWGDKYPSLRLIGTALELKAEPYMEIIPYGTIPEEIASANARLIAAAPELLEALETVLPDLKHYVSMCGPGPDARLERALIAINKATGEE